jgi:outer membrane protein TolC
MLHKSVLAILIAAGLSAGCAVGPDYVRPDTPMPQQYLGQPAIDQRHATAHADLIAWWTGFGDPQLTRFVTLALAQNLDLAQASARVTQARASLGRQMPRYCLPATSAARRPEPTSPLKHRWAES